MMLMLAVIIFLLIVVIAPLGDDGHDNDFD